MRAIRIIIVLFLMSISSALAAELRVPDFQDLQCNYKKSDWLVGANMFFRGTRAYRVKYYYKFDRSRGPYFVLINVPSRNSRCNEKKVLSVLSVSGDAGGGDFTQDCHHLRKERYATNQILFGYYDLNMFGQLERPEQYGFYRPYVAWEIRTDGDDKFVFKKFEGDDTKDIICVVLPGNIDP